MSKNKDVLVLTTPPPYICVTHGRFVVHLFHNIYSRTVRFERMLSELCNWLKPVYMAIGQCRMHCKLQKITI